ncbi:hypothetical protein RHSIM_Rhsim08G0190700 [Rhododendron simsii]|uniref:Core Histone H2A/H2B/H3 domain-containing protein n=1 Tax=Rhododendron simsii TaxID=118357 RepID=A0A834GKV6_RHOSS|nr:hypothetical protein RHSIM_Rhsim08G0190700 [Rhododendron simsii]
MEDNPQLPPPQPTAAPSPFPPQPPYHHLLQQQQQQLQMFWTYQRQEIDQANDFKNHQLPLARIKKIMKADEDVRMISAEAPILFAKACELFILELTIRSWLHAEENKRRTLQKNDIAAAITRTDIFDFLVDIVPRDEMKDEGLMVGGPNSNSTASGVPYYYPPAVMGAAAGGMMMGRPAVDPMYLAAPPSQAWQSVWQTGVEDGGYGGGEGNLDGQGRGWRMGGMRVETGISMGKELFLRKKIVHGFMLQSRKIEVGSISGEELWDTFELMAEDLRLLFILVTPTVTSDGVRVLKTYTTIAFQSTNSELVEKLTVSVRDAIILGGTKQKLLSLFILSGM